MAIRHTETAKILKQMRGTLKERILLVGLFLVNYAMIWRFFSYEFSYAFSAPVIPGLAGLFGLFGVDFDVALRSLLLVFYAFGPLSLYLFVRELTGRRMSAVISAILYSLPIFRSRFEAIVFSGDGAHIAALTLVPLVAFWLSRFLKRGSFPSAIGTCFGILAVALVSPFGLFALLGVMLVVTFSEMLLGTGRIKLLRFLVVLVLAGGLSAFWYNPEFVRLSLVSAPGQAVVAAVKNLIPLSFFIVPILGTFGFLIFDKRAHLQPLFVALGLTIVFGLISFAGGLAKFAVSSQSRYLPEVSLAIAVLWGVVGAFAYDVVGYFPRQRWFPIPEAKRALVQRALAIGFVVVALILVFAFPYRETTGRGSGRRVAGVTDSVVIDIGEIRERTGGSHRIVGFFISGVTALVMAGMYWWLRKEEKRL